MKQAGEQKQIKNSPSNHIKLFFYSSFYTIGHILLSFHLHYVSNPLVSTADKRNTSSPHVVLHVTYKCLQITAEGIL